MKMKHKDIAIVLNYKQKHIRDKIFTYWILKEKNNCHYLTQRIKLYWFIILFIPCLLITFLLYGIMGIKEQFPIYREVTSWPVSKNTNIRAYEYLKEKGYIKD